MWTLLRELDELGCRPLVVASHPRSGTHLCIDALRLNCPAFRSSKAWFERADRLYLGLDDVARSGEVRHALIRKVMTGRLRPLVKTHALPGLLETGLHRAPRRLDAQLADWLNRRADFIYMYRDGRDALCSLWQFMKGINRVDAWARHVRLWLGWDAVQCLAMEQLLQGPNQSLGKLAQSLGARLNDRRMVLAPRCGAGLLGRVVRRIISEPLSTAIVPLSRTCRFDNWRHVFLPKDREFFHRHAGDMLVELGYESSDAWVDSRPGGSAPPVRVALLG